MMKRVLLIGLGGSGERTAIHFQQELKRYLRSIRWEGDDVSSWRTLCIDVARSPDRDVPVLDGDSGGAFERVGLANPSLSVRDYTHKLTSVPETLKGLIGTLPSPEQQLPFPSKGAGQRPQVGHIVGLAELMQIKDRLEDHLTAVKTTQAINEQLDLRGRLHVNTREGAVEPGVKVLVIASLCGGAGAGLLQPVIEVLCSLIEPRDELSTVLYTPDVFKGFSAGDREGVCANALFTTSVLLNAHEAAGHVPNDLAQLLNTAGVTLGEKGRAATTNFFVGGENDAIRLTRPDDTFKATAKALFRAAMDERVAGGLAAHHEVNRTGAPVSDEYPVVDPTGTNRPASSLGYASVSVLGSVLGDYTSERLAKAAVETILYGQRRFRMSKNERDDATIERLVREHRDRFVEHSRLSAKGVLADLYQHDAQREQAKQQTQSVVAQLDAHRKAPMSHWRMLWENLFVSLEQQREEEIARQLQTAAERWSLSAGNAVLDAAVKALGHYGAAVTLGLIDATRTHVRELATEYDRERRERITPHAETLAAEARAMLASAAERAVNGDTASTASIPRGKSLFLGEEAIYLARAAELLRELDQAVLLPLHTTIARGAEQLARSEREEHNELVTGWSARAVPPRLHPSENELLLEPVDVAPASVDALLQQTLGVVGVAAAEARAAGELITGRWPSNEAPAGEQTLIRCDSPWNTGATSAGSARYELQLDAETLLKRSRAWVQERRGALRDRLRTSITEWIAQDAGRGAAFTDRMEAAIVRAEPLTKLNAAVHLRVHRAAPSPAKLYVSRIPLRLSSPEAQRLLRILQPSMGDGEPQGLFDETSTVSTVEVSAFMAQPVEPVVLGGLYPAILEDWRTRTDDPRRSQFAAFRRTRPLTSFVPLSPQRQHDFAVGWIVARLLDQVDGLSASPGGTPLSVWTPRGRRRFPLHLLGGDIEEAADALGAVLLSLPLAMAAFAQGVGEELEAYRRVLELGRQSELRAWLADGSLATDATTGSPAPSPPAATAGGPAEDPVLRATTMIATLDRWEGEFSGRIARRPVTAETVATLAPRWEIDELFHAAAADVRETVQSARGPGLNGRVPSPEPEAAPDGSAHAR